MTFLVGLVAQFVLGVEEGQNTYRTLMARFVYGALLHEWAYYQVRKIAGCACVGNAGNVFPANDVKGNR